MVNFKRYKPILGSSNLVSGNIKSGVKIFNVTGTLKEADTMISTSVTIAAGKTVTIPRSTDLVNSIVYINSAYWGYVTSSTKPGWNPTSNHCVIIADISDTTITVKNGSSTYTGTLYYSYAD